MPVEWRYMPILKWKQGEQIALRNLTKRQWVGLTPLLELPAIDAAPDQASLKANLPDYLTKVAAQLTKNVPEGSAVCVDTCYLSQGYYFQFELLLMVCHRLQELVVNRKIIPVVHASTLESLAGLHHKQLSYLKDQEDVILRFITDKIEALQVLSVIDEIVSAGITKGSIHLLVDQYSLLGRKASDCFEAVKEYLDYAKAAGCLSVTVAGGSFPMNLMGRPQGITDIPRVEWGVWQMLLACAEYPALRYADYAVTNPAPLPDIDATKMNPSIAIRYALVDRWKLYKGKGFKSGIPGEYKGLAKLLTMDGAVFSGETFSYGDRQYKIAASGGDANGNPSSWRKEATSHHIVLTASLL